MNHEELVEMAKEVINRVFSDTSVSRSATRTSLEGLKEEIDSCLVAIDEDADEDEDN